MSAIIGLSRATARLIDPDAHLAQSIADVLFTPLGSRVMRRAYGSAIPDLIDAPINGDTLIDVYAAAAEALDRWEPRIRLTRVALVEADETGRAGIALDFEHRATGTADSLVVGAPA